ncbi:MAG: hypothetical protein ACAH11_08600 [Sphingomonas sp.]
MIVISLGNLAAANASAPAAASYALASYPEWLQIWLAIAGILLGLAIGGVSINMLMTLNQRFPELGMKHDKFVDGLLKGVRKHTERLQREFAAAIHVPPTLPNNAVAYIRDLRRMLRDTTAYIAHMRAYPMPEWPSTELAHAFADWAGVIDSMDSLLDDMFRESIAAIERHSWVELFEQYKREEWNIRRDIERLPALKAAIEKEAKPFQKKKPEPKPL